MNYVLHSLLWSAIGFFAGVGVGYLIFAPSRKETRMSIRNTFSIRDLGLGVLVAVLGIYTLVSSHNLADARDRDRDCLLSYIANNSDTQKIRSALVAVESQATRNVIQSTLTATTRQQVIEARRQYEQALRRIDQGRDANPVRQFDESRCE